MLTKPSIVIVNGINKLGQEIANNLGNKSQILVVGKTKDESRVSFPKHISVVDYDLFPSVKLSKIKTIIILEHEKKQDLISANELVDNAKFLADIFNIANANKAHLIITTSLSASKQHLLSKYSDKDSPYDFPSLQNLIEKLALEQNRKTPTVILRIGDLFGVGINNGIIFRMIKDAVISNYVKVDDDGLEKVFPITTKQIAESISNLLNIEKFKGGIYTLAPKEGLTQMSIANMCMEYSNSISYIKFTKTKYNNHSADPMYENLYTPSPYLSNLSLDKNIEDEISQIANSIRKGDSVKPEHDKYKKNKKIDQSHKEKSAQMKLTSFVIYVVLFFIFLLLLIVPPSFIVINTKLLDSGNKVFIDNYNRSNNSEINTDVAYNQDKITNMLNTIPLAQWIFPLISSDKDNNQKYVQAQQNFFDALIYSRDYKFITVEDSSKSIVQLRLTAAKSLIDGIDKSKLFWDLKNNFDDMKKIIDNANIN